MKVINLIKKFELQMMKKYKIKEYSNKLLDIANEIKLHGKEFFGFKLVEKIIVTMLQKYEAYVTFLKNAKKCL